MKSHQKGFTLVEIAIVLVIIGLLMGGVLKGQELINSAKVKNFANDFRNIPVFVYAYQDKFRALPGDDKNVAGHLGTIGTQAATIASTQTIGNGVIEGNYNSVTTSNESFLFWQHIRLANLAAGPTNTGDANYAPTNADGGRIGVQGGTAPITGLTGTYFVCSEGILGKFAKQLDQTLDDGDTAAGSVRVAIGPYSSTALTAAPLTGTGAVVDAQTYIVCMGF